MARKVFISFLGTSNYVEIKYSMQDGSVSAPVRFIQEALILSHCNNWTEQDKVYIFCTNEAEVKNWRDNGQTLAKNPIDTIGLEHRLRDNFGLFSIVEMVKIPDGFSESEIWDIFDIVYNKLEQDDVVHFDVTHAFRSIPLFSTVLFNYSHFLKNTNVVSVSYGAFEKLGPAYAVRDMPLEERIAPVISLTNVVRLQQFTDISSSLKSFGRVKKLSDSLSDYSNIKPISEMIQGLNDFDEYLTTNRMEDIKKGLWMKSIISSIEKVKKSRLPIPLKKTIEHLQIEMSGFVPSEDYANVEEAIAWAKKYKMLPTAYTMGQELIVSFVADKYCDKNPIHHKSKNKSKKEFREYISSLCSISNEDISKGNFRNNLGVYRELTEELLLDPHIQELRLYYPKLAQNRNTLNHAKNTSITYSELVSDFEEFYDKCIQIAKNIC